MKSLLDIQQDVRRLEKSIQELTADVGHIHSDIENIRNSSEGMDLDFSEIEILARQFKFGKHPLGKLRDDRVCQVYLEMLLNLVRLDPDAEEGAIIKRLVFIQWLRIQSQTDWSFEDLYKACFKTDKKLYLEFSELIPKNYREYFLADALIVANISGTANVTLYEYIADVVTILGLSSAEVKLIAMISKIALSQRVEGVKREERIMLLKKLRSFSHYLNGSMAEDLLSETRVIAVNFPDSSVVDFKWKVKQSQKVECGDVIATYKKEKRKRGYTFEKQYETKEIKAPVSGTIFQFRNNKTDYGVISHEKDTKDAIKSWIKTLG